MFKPAIGMLALLLISGTALALPAAPNCSTSEGKTQAEAATKILLGSVKEAQRKREAGLDVDAAAAQARAKWTGEQKSRFYMDLMASRPFAELEQQKKPMTTELMAMLRASAESKSDNAICTTLERLRQLVEQIKSINERQYDYMAAEIGKVK